MAVAREESLFAQPRRIAGHSVGALPAGSAWGSSGASLASAWTASLITRSVTSLRQFTSAWFNSPNSGHSTWSTKPRGTRGTTVVCRWRR